MKKILLISLLIFLPFLLISLRGEKKPERESTEYYSGAIGVDGELLLGTDRGLVRGRLDDDRSEITLLDEQTESGPLSFLSFLKSAKETTNQSSVKLVSVSPHNQELIFVETEEGLFRSVDNGSSWSEVGNFQEINSIDYHPIASDKLIVSTLHELWESDDSGENWRRIRVPDALDRTITSLRYGIVNPETLYLTTNGDGIFKSGNRGGTWVSISKGLPYLSREAELFTKVGMLVPDPTDSQILYATAQFGKVLKSENGGLNWNALDNQLPYSAFPVEPPLLVADPSQKGRVYLAITASTRSHSAEHFIYASDNSGETWYLLSTLTSHVRSLILEASEQVLIAITPSQVRIFTLE